MTGKIDSTRLSSLFPPVDPVKKTSEKQPLDEKDQKPPPEKKEQDEKKTKPSEFDKILNEAMKKYQSVVESEKEKNK